MDATIRSLNIGRCHADDPFYRYQMPAVVVKEERDAVTGANQCLSI